MYVINEKWANERRRPLDALSCYDACNNIEFLVRFLERNPAVIFDRTAPAIRPIVFYFSFVFKRRFEGVPFVRGQWTRQTRLRHRSGRPVGVDDPRGSGTQTKGSRPIQASIILLFRGVASSLFDFAFECRTRAFLSRSRKQTRNLAENKRTRSATIRLRLVFTVFTRQDVERPFL